jgi:hypothetical protein
MSRRSSRIAGFEKFLMGSGWVFLVALLGCGGSPSDPTSVVSDDSASQPVAEVGSPSAPEGLGPENASGSVAAASDNSPGEPSPMPSNGPTASSSGATPASTEQTNETSPTVAQGDPFKMLQTAMELEGESRRAIGLAQAQKWDEAEQLLSELIEKAPFLPEMHYNLACILALHGKKDEALSRLRKAVEAGFVDPEHIASDLDLVSLRPAPEFQQILKLASDLQSKPFNRVASAPAVVESDTQVARIGPEQAVLDGRFKLIRTFVDWSQPPEVKPEFPVVEHGEVGELLRKWYAEGTAAGNWGDIYDNCDRIHSKHNHLEFGTLTRIKPQKEIEKLWPYGLQTLMLHDGVVIGNSSTAATGNALWRSNPRRAYVNSGLTRKLYLQYTSNHLYLYPEHKDYRSNHEGDVYPANTPYVITSKGSSYTDQPFMDALFCTLAAFQPEVKQKIVDAGIMAPTLQWVFRRSNKNVPDDETYLSGVAHPAVFTKEQLDPLGMVQRAHDLRGDQLPPLVRLKVLEEDQGQPGRDFFDVANRTRLFDTPCAIARVYRTVQPTTRIVVSAEDSYDVNGLPLTYRWKVLSGDAEQVMIRPLDPSGKVVELTIPYMPQHPILPGSSLNSNRIEIGAFVHNGHHYSAPAFVTYFSLNNEERVYDEVGTIQQVTYRGGTDKGNYVDPMVDAPKSWRDEYRYNDQGQMVGWTRHIQDRQDEFTWQGLLVTERDSQGRAIEGAVVQYYPVPLETRPLMRLDYRPTDRKIKIQYQNEADQRGELQLPPR